MLDYFRSFGVSQVNIGLFKDSVAIPDDTNLTMWFSNKLFGELYHRYGGARFDPIAHHIAVSLEPGAFDAESGIRVLKKSLGSSNIKLPGSLEHLLDHKMNKAIAVPGCDLVTGAKYGVNLPFLDTSQQEFLGTFKEYGAELSQSLSLVWEHVQRNRLLADTPGLSCRERESLQFVARGFKMAEMAERLHVSRRSAEKFLAGARSKLGARNNAQAVYRAMVYRAL